MASAMGLDSNMLMTESKLQMRDTPNPSLTLENLPSSQEAMNMQTPESTALLRLYQQLSLDQSNYVSGKAPVLIPSGVLFALIKMHFLQYSSPQAVMKEFKQLLKILPSMPSIHITGLGVDSDPRVLDCSLFKSCRILLIEKMNIQGINGVSSVANLTLRECKIDAPLHNLDTIRWINFDRTAVQTKNLPHIAYSVRRFQLDRNPGDFIGALWKVPVQEDRVEGMQPWESLSQVSFDGCRRQFQKLDQSWERLVNLSTLSLCNLEIRSLKQLEILQRCVSLQNFDLSNNRINSLEFIATIAPNVVKLNLSGNVVEALGAIVSLPKLRHLAIDSNQIEEWAEMSDLAAACPEILTLSVTGNPMMARIREKEDIQPLLAAVFNFKKSVTIDGENCAQYKSRATSEQLLSKYINLFKQRADDNKSATSERISMRSSMRASASPRGSGKRQKVIRGQIIVDQKHEDPLMPESQLDYDDRHQTAYTMNKVDFDSIPEEKKEMWLVQLNDRRQADRQFYGVPSSAAGDELRREEERRAAALAAAAAEQKKSQETATAKEKPQEIEVAAKPPAPKKVKKVKMVKKPVKAANADTASPEASPPPPAAKGPLRTEDFLRQGRNSLRGSMQRDTLQSSQAPAASATPASPVTVAPAKTSSPGASANSRTSASTRASGAGDIPSSPTPSGSMRFDSNSSRVLDRQPSSPILGGSTPGSSSRRLMPQPVVAQRRDDSGHNLPRQAPTRAPVPLLQTFLDQLGGADWMRINERDVREKIFAAGAQVYLSAFCGENASIWGLDTDTESADANPRSPKMQSRGGDRSQVHRRVTNIEAHRTALEVLIHDARDGSHTFSDRFKNKALIRIVEFQSGYSRYVRLEASTIVDNMHLPDWPVRPIITVPLDAQQPTQPLDREVNVVFNENARASKRGSSLAVVSDAFDTAEGTSHHGGTGSSAMDPGRVGREVYRVSKPQLLAGFIIESGPAADLLLTMVKNQLLRCHDRLCSAGIINNWPLNLDDTAVNSDRERSVPVKITLPYVFERIAKHTDEDVSRQRVGCPCQVIGEELQLNLKSYAFSRELHKEVYLCTVYANLLQDVFSGGELAVLVVITNQFVVLVEDRNFHGKGGSTNPDDTFQIIQRVPLNILEYVEISFNLQTIRFRSDDMADYLIHTRDAGCTLTMLSALKRSKAGAGVDVRIAECGYPELTKAPLIFSISLFMRDVGKRYVKRSGDGSYPLRHVADNVQPVTMVITASDIIMMTEMDVMTETYSTMEVQRAPLSTVVALNVAADGVFPLVFALDVNNLERGRRDRWILTAQHPNAVASVYEELRSLVPRLQLGELTMAEYKSGVIQ